MVRNAFHWLSAAMAAALPVLVLAPSLALAAPSASNGVFLVHGTGNYTAGASANNPTDGSAVTDYWTLSSINSMVTAPGGGKWAYGVAGYQGAAQNAQTAWSDVANQLMKFVHANGSVQNVVVVAHSNGGNVVRYWLAHPTSTFIDTYNGATVPLAQLVGGTYNSVTYPGMIKKVILVASSSKGTPLAQKVTSSGSLANIGNAIYSLFGSSWNNPAVAQQIPANMTTYNSGGVFATGTAPNGMSTVAYYGTAVYAAIWSSDAWCGGSLGAGYATTVGLKAAAAYGWPSGTQTDGFIDAPSARYVGVDGNGTAGSGGDSRLNHNQSRRSCHGFATTVSSAIHGASGNTFAAPPTDYNEPPASQACNATTRGWATAGPIYAGYDFWYGCSSTMKGDTTTDFDCQLAYGGDNNANFTFDLGLTANVTMTNADDGTTETISTPVTDSYSTSWYGPSTNIVTCSDSWLGDGECDLCLVAKYGYDGKPGNQASDDCVVHDPIATPPTCRTTTVACTSDTQCSSGKCDKFMNYCVWGGTTPCTTSSGAFYGCKPNSGQNGSGTCVPVNRCADVAWYDSGATSTPTYTPTATNTHRYGSPTDPGVGYYSYVAVH